MPALTPPKTRRRPWLGLLALAAGGALLHLVLWQGVADSFAASPTPERNTASVQVRTVSPVLAPPAPVVAVAVVPQAAPPPRRALRAPAPPAPEPEPVSGQGLEVDGRAAGGGF